jgi:GNAT superfamily N-acetyltransferase
MISFLLRPARREDAADVAGVAVALETSLYGQTAYSQADLEDEWADLDLERDTRVVVDGDRIVGYGSLRDRGELWRTEGLVHPEAQGRGAGKELATTLEREAADRGARRVQSGVFEVDDAGRRLLESLGYRPVRAFREMRIDLEGRPSAPAWPEGLRAGDFDPERDAREFHAAHQEAFADHWEHRPHDFGSWRRYHVEGERFDASLWCVVRDGDEIVAGTICTADTYGGGWVQVLFTRRAWRGRGVGAALLHDAFGRFWARGERSIGLGVDAQSDTGAFRLYERAGMRPVLGWVMYEKELDGAA